MSTATVPEVDSFIDEVLTVEEEPDAEVLTVEKEPVAEEVQSPESVVVPEEPRLRRWQRLRLAISWVVTIILVAFLALAVVVALIPALHGGKPLTILTGSMEPTFYPGDLAIVYKADSFDQVKTGDIITYEPNPEDPTLITHRLVGWTIDSQGTKMAITQGDANNVADPPLYEKQLRAVYQYHIPKLGYILKWGADEFSKPWILVIAAAILIAYSIIILITTSIQRSILRHQEENQTPTDQIGRQIR